MRADAIARALGGRRCGSGWIACCPAHEDHTPSLSIRDSECKILVHCHAGCEQERVISALRSRGLWGGSSPYPSLRITEQHRGELDPGDAKRRAALGVWQCSTPARGTLVETYFASRGLHVAIPSAVRFHRGLKHPSGGFWPAMVALVTRGPDDTPLAIHRTFLTRDSAGKAPVDPQKMMLGPCRGGAVRLGDPGDELMVGEGIETCLTAMQATGHAAWAALSTSGLRALQLPSAVHDVIVLADGDEPGEAAAREAALRWIREGRRVRIARPPRGLDFNDLLLGRCTSAEGACHDRHQ